MSGRGNSLQARGFASAKAQHRAVTGFEKSGGAMGNQKAQGHGAYLNCRHQTEARMIVLWSKGNSQSGPLIEIDPEYRPRGGFGSFVQIGLCPLTGVTWLGCDAAGRGVPLD